MGHKTKVVHVYETLKEEIQQGMLLPGTPIKLQETADRFALSYIPIREALRNLEKEDYVEQLPHLSFVVTSISTKKALWAIELRQRLEPRAVVEAMPYLKDADFQVLDSLIEHLDEALKTEDIQQFVKHNYLFHRCILQVTPNFYLSRFCIQLTEITNRFRMTGSYQNNFMQAQKEHKKILKSLRNNKAAKVTEVVTTHMEHLLSWLHQEVALQTEAD